MVDSVSIEQAASMCGVSSETVRRRIRARQLPGAKQGGPGGAWVIPVDALRSSGLLKQTERERDLQARVSELESVCAERQSHIDFLESTLCTLVAGLTGVAR